MLSILGVLVFEKPQGVIINPHISMELIIQTLGDDICLVLHSQETKQTKGMKDFRDPFTPVQAPKSGTYKQTESTNINIGLFDLIIEFY